jgi:mRNA interferase MazF
MKRSDVWWVEFDPAISSEKTKRRPAIIVSNDSVNRNPSRVVVIPVTSSTSRVFPGEALVKVGSQTSKAMADQIMAADKSRLKNQVGALSKADMELVEHAIRVHLSLAI